eukprot:908411-Lingulodinium_polyedra.AAC.1
MVASAPCRQESLSRTDSGAKARAAFAPFYPIWGPKTSGCIRQDSCSSRGCTPCVTTSLTPSST